jgi:hypothetical protein
MSLDSALSRFIDRVDPLCVAYVDIHKRATAPGWRQLQRIAAALAPKLRKPFLAAIAAAKAGARVDEIEAALDRGDVTAAVKILDRAWQTEGKRVLETEFIAPFMSGFQRAGLVSVKLVSAKPFEFAVDNPRGLQWAQQHAAELVTTLDIRPGVKVQIERMVESGMSARETAKAIRGVRGFGLTDRQALAVENYRAALETANVAPGRVERQHARYYERMLDYRAMTIARTESMFAVNGGYHETLLQAVDEGLLDAQTTVRVWETAGQDGAICDECWDAQGTEAGIGEAFPNGAMFPPLHAKCRCTVVTEQR